MSMTSGESVAGNAEKRSPIDFCLGLNVVLAESLVDWFEQKCLRSSTRHPTAQRKLMNLKNICNATEITPPWGLAWPIAATC